jgi:hypothetical protein
MTFSGISTLIEDNNCWRLTLAIHLWGTTYSLVSLLKIFVLLCRFFRG